MKAPSTSSASQSTGHDDGRSKRRPSPLTNLPPLARAGLALFILVVASVLTLLQSPRPDAFRPPRPFLSSSWWRYPLEWNAPSRLPKIECSLNAIQAVPNTSYVWAVGNLGMVVASVDGGLTWTKRGIEQSHVTAPAAPTPAPAPTGAPATTSFLSLPDLIPAAAAAEISADQKPVSGSTQQGPYKPTPTPPADSGFQRSGNNSRPTPTPTRSGPPANNVQRNIPPRSQASASPSPSRTPGATSTPTLPPSAEFEADPTRHVETQSLISVYFSDQNRGEAVSSFFARFTTVDGGSSWVGENIHPPSSPPFIPYSQHLPLWSFQHVSDAPSREYIAVSYSGKVYDVSSTSHRELGGWDKLYGVHFLGDPEGTVWLVGAQGSVSRIHNGTDGDMPFPATNDLHAVYFTNTNRGWIAGSNGIIFATNDGGTSWQPQTSDTQSQLNAINFLPDGQQGWLAGEDGLILSTDDGGATWVHRTQGKDASGRYLRFPAPWYFLVVIVAGLTLLRRREEPAGEPEESIADVLISDRPLDKPSGDVLSFNAIALGLSRFLRNENTLPPLTIAIIGEWGTGKSSLMNLLRADLRSYRFRPVWFNAWHHQKEEHMLASLLENIKLQAVPRWWTNRGLSFRARLLRIRGWRHWAPLMLLLFFIYVLLIYHFSQHGTDSNFSSLINTLSAPFSKAGSPEDASRLVTLVPLLAGVVTFMGALWRGITAFGVKPASLLAGVSSGVSIRGLEAQTSFRQKFAVEFSDVTRALGERSLLIFIDDLDRCRPENVLETLEAVNFLTTSGDCFVVIGMAREYVERCVGRAFKDIAEEMIDDVNQEPLPGQSEEQAKEDRSKERRIEFARQYLDKLINIEVPVPTAKPEQSLKLLLSGTGEAQEVEENQKRRGFKSWLARAVARHWRVVPALATAVILLVAGYYLALNVMPNQSVTITPPATPSPTPDLRASASPTPRAIALTRPAASPVPTPTPVPTPDLRNQRAEIASGGRGLVSRNVIPSLGLLSLIWIGMTILTRRPGLVVKDSEPFEDALKIWHKIIFSKACTPRSTKRFMNHVRYLAMRQRQPADNLSLLARIFFSRKPAPADGSGGENLSAVPGKGSDTKPIPDEALVALAALEHFNRLCLGEDYSALWPSKVDPKSPEWELLKNARTEHETKFGSFGDVLQYRQRFLEMSAGVEMH